MTAIPPAVEIKKENNTQDDFQDIYAQYKRKVLNTSLNIVQNLEDAEEITQDVFVKLYYNLHLFQGNSSLGTWIYKITINKSLDLLKKKKRKKRFAWLSSLFDAESGKELHIITDFIHPGVLMENQEETAILFQYIEKLPDKQKTALVLSAIEQLSYEEISKVMDTSVSSVESLLFRARQNLKKWLTNHNQKK